MARFWVGGGGNWTDTTHWSTSSGGASGAAVPTSSDDVTLDANSGTGTITLDGVPQPACHNFDMHTSTIFSIQFIPNYLQVYGNLTLKSNLVQSGNVVTSFNMVATDTGHTITTNGAMIPGFFFFQGGTGGAWTLQDDLNVLAEIDFDTGSLNTNGKTITSPEIFLTGSDTKTLTLGASTLNLGDFDISGATNLTLNAGTSQINLTNTNSTFITNTDNLAFNNITFTQVGNFTIGNTFTANTLTFQSGSTVTVNCGSVITLTTLNAISTTFQSASPPCTYTINATNVNAQNAAIGNAIVLGATSPFNGFVILNGTDNGGNANLVFISGSAYVTDAIKTLGSSITVAGEVFQINTVSISEHGFVYSSVNNPTVADTKVVDNGSSSYFQTTITPTPQNGIKFIRAYAITSAGIFYGNAINLLIHLLDSAIPKFSIPKDALHMTIPFTDASLVDQGYIYNQAGFTYNQLGVDYGGVDATAGQDIVPMLQFADPTTPHNISFGDIYTTINPTPPPAGGKNGPGWFLFVNLT